MDKVVISTDRYAAVDYFDILQKPVPSGIVRGIASPASGPKPCALGLFSGQIMISTVVASNFSTAAKDRNVRLGWCGFQIDGLSQALATGQNVELRCLVSGKVQTQWQATVLAVGIIPQHQKYLTVEDMLKRLGDDSACTDLSQTLSFALAFAQTSGTRLFLQASFHYFLGRLPDAAAEREYAGDYTTSKAILDFWHILSNSPERAMQATLALPGPFNPLFPFPLAAIDER